MSTPYVDDSGEVRLSGHLTAPGATTGDVLTVQADKTVSPAPGGGSQAYDTLFVPLAFNTPNLVVTGALIGTLATGDAILNAGSYMSITTVWNGTTPVLNLGTLAPGASDIAGNGDLTNLNTIVGSELGFFPGLGSAAFFNSIVGVFVASAPYDIYAQVTQLGSTDDPVSTQGAGTLALMIARAT